MYVEMYRRLFFFFNKVYIDAFDLSRKSQRHQRIIADTCLATHIDSVVQAWYECHC